MPSIRARLLNAFLRITTKSMWKPGLDISQVRGHAAKMDARIARKALPVAVEAVEIAGVKAMWIGDPSLSERGTLLYLHGGAWCIHLPGIYRKFATILSGLTGMRVLLPDYRLAPEHPFPAGVDDCFAVYRWLAEQGYTNRPLAIAGDSAGGNLTLVTLMRARDAMLPMPDCAVMLSPSTDLTTSGPSWSYNAEADPMFSPASRDLLRPIYCPDQDMANPLLSPLFGSWAGLPPLLFHAGSTEVLLDDSVRSQDRASQAGVDAEIQVWWQMPHVFQVFNWLPESRAALQKVADFIATRTLRKTKVTTSDAPPDGVPAAAVTVRYVGNNADAAAG
jgi:monoterpene epsilon-lactone hydrolase